MVERWLPPAPWPGLWAPGRRGLVCWVVALGLLQALAMAGMAVGIRASFVALPAAKPLPVWPLVLVVVTGVLLGVARWQEKSSGERLGQRYASAVRRCLFQALSVPANARSGQPPQLDSVQRLTGDLAAIRLWIGQGVLRALVSAVRLGVLALFLVWWMPAPLMLGVVACMAAGLLGMYAVSMRLAAAHTGLRRSRWGVARFLVERLPHAQALALAGRMPRETSALDRRMHRLEQEAVRRQNLHGLMRSVPDGVRGLAVAWVLAVAMALQMPAADAAACLAVVGLMVPGLRELAGVWDKHAAWQVVKARVQPWLDSAADEDGDTGPPPSRAQGFVPDLPGAVGVHEVCSDDLVPVTSPLAPGQKVLLQAEEQGLRQQWLEALACALSAPGAKPAARRRQPPQERSAITLVNATAPLLAGSLRRAATFGSPRRPADQRILTVLKEVGLQPLVDRLGGLDGRLRWGGTDLSDNERRRLLLARAMLSRAELVLLDDLEMALTPELAAAIRRWLGRRKGSVVMADTYTSAALEDMTVWRLFAR
ncbi:MAG: hypothetical protein ACK40L_05380 [Hydrogenophaga sp.]